MTKMRSHQAPLRPRLPPASDPRPLLSDLRNSWSSVSPAGKEPGCKHASLLEDRKQAGRFLTFETWADQAAVGAHMITPRSKPPAGARPHPGEALHAGISEDGLGRVRPKSPRGTPLTPKPLARVVPPSQDAAHSGRRMSRWRTERAQFPRGSASLPKSATCEKATEEKRTWKRWPVTRLRALTKAEWRRCALPSARPSPSGVAGVTMRWTWLGIRHSSTPRPSRARMQDICWCHRNHSRNRSANFSRAAARL